MAVISIIVCARQSSLSKEMQSNIASTIGCDYELVVIDNSTNKYNIFQAYNEGVSRAKGDILCFVHDDVLFRSNNWGTIIADLLKDESIGIVGFAGAHFLPSVPFYWWDTPFISQYDIDNKKLQSHCDYMHDNIADVLVVDGMCFFIPQPLFNFIQFDDITYNGFHAYDIDICMQIQQYGKRVCVTNLVLIEHFWADKVYNDIIYMTELEKNVNVFFDKWKSFFPCVCGIKEDSLLVEKINQLCVRIYDAKMDAFRARHSKSYQLGHFMLSPIKWLQSKLK